MAWQLATRKLSPQQQQILPAHQILLATSGNTTSFAIPAMNI